MRRIKKYINRLINKNRDLYNILRYGIHAPKVGELIYIPTSKLIYQLKGSHGDRRCSGIVTSSNWYPETDYIKFHEKIQYCILHWKYGIPWEKTDAYNLSLRRIKICGHADGRRSYEEVQMRFSDLDEIFNKVKKEGRLQSENERFNSKKEKDGILIHLNHLSEPLWGGGGSHRLSMAMILDLTYIPAQIGYVHPSAIESLHYYRQIPK